MGKSFDSGIIPASYGRPGPVAAKCRVRINMEYFSDHIFSLQYSKVLDLNELNSVK